MCPCNCVLTCGHFVSAEFNLDMLVEHARAAEKKEEKESKIPAIRLSQSSQSLLGRGTPHMERSMPLQSDQKSHEGELESDRQLQNRRPSGSAALSAQGKVESGKLEVARTQYLKLKEERMSKVTQRAKEARTLPVPSSQPSKTVVLPTESQKVAAALQSKAPHTPASGTPPLTTVHTSSNTRGGYRPPMSSPSPKVAPSSRLASSRRVGGEQRSSVGTRRGQGTSAQSPPHPPKPTEKSEADKSKGGKNEGKTWKEKALQLREKSGQSAISILHKLQHQVHLTAAHTTCIAGLLDGLLIFISLHFHIQIHKGCVSSMF